MKNKCVLLFICLALLYAFVGCNFPITQYHDTDVISVIGVANDPSIPKEYLPVLADFKDMLLVRLSDTFESEILNGRFASPNPVLEYEWGCMIVESLTQLDNPQISSFGYVLKDINHDGTVELFMVRKDYQILAIYTIYEGDVHLIGAYWPRNKCVVTDSGHLYIRGSGSAFITSYKLCMLEKGGITLKSSKEFGTDEVLVNNTVVDRVFYEFVEGEKIIVTKERFEKLLNQYPFEISKEWENSIIYPLEKHKSTEIGTEEHR